MVFRTASSKAYDGVKPPTDNAEHNSMRSAPASKAACADARDAEQISMVYGLLVDIYWKLFP